MGVYRMYQRQLWDVSYGQGDPPAETTPVEEWHFHRLGSVGIFMFDLRGNRSFGVLGINADGTRRSASLLSDKQKKAVEEIFHRQELRCIILCSELPYVWERPEIIRSTLWPASFFSAVAPANFHVKDAHSVDEKGSKRKSGRENECEKRPGRFVEQHQKGENRNRKAARLGFLKDHWPYNLSDLTWLLDLCFEWKAASSKREVLLLGGDLHVSVYSVIYDEATGSVIRSVTTSPVANHVSRFYAHLEGRISERYSYRHEPLPESKDRDFFGAPLTASSKGCEHACNTDAMLVVMLVLMLTVTLAMLMMLVVMMMMLAVVVVVVVVAVVALVVAALLLMVVGEDDNDDVSV
eukprot:s504_g2.t1